MKFSIAMIAGLFLVASASYAGVTINGTTITFNDNSMQSTAKPPDHGGTNNTVIGMDSFIGGGYSNLVTDNFGTISGGQGNVAGLDNGSTQNSWATVGGGDSNTASGDFSFIGGGLSNLVTDNYGTIGGGRNNQAGNNESGIEDRLYATVGGGRFNTASGISSTVGGGQFNTASGNYSTVGGGNSNTASGGYSTVDGGRLNTASGDFSTVAGGFLNMASGNYSFVAGRSANDGGFNNVFVWDDTSGSDATAANTFNVWASGGIILNGVVSRSSDRDMKEAFSFVSAREVLDKVVEMPVTTWRFKTEDDSVRHIGPMAQDFMAAFGYGVDDTHITSTDMDGVALAAIQGLYAMQREELQEQAEVNTALRWHNAQLEARLARLEKAILREAEPGPTETD